MNYLSIVGEVCTICSSSWDLGTHSFRFRFPACAMRAWRHALCESEPIGAFSVFPYPLLCMVHGNLGAKRDWAIATQRKAYCAFIGVRFRPDILAVLLILLSTDLFCVMAQIIEHDNEDLGHISKSVYV